jgi:hypothetical protein
MTKLQIKKESKKMISELKKYYPIPNGFLGLDVKESKKHLQSLIDDIKVKESQLLSK